MNAYKNDVILDSIGVNKSLKRYIIQKWRWLVNHNGEAFASKVFSDTKEVLMAYRSDPDRHSKRKHYADQLPFKRTKWSWLLLKHMDHTPHLVIDLVKIYTGLPKPTDDLVQTMTDHAEFLANKETPDNYGYNHDIRGYFYDMVDRYISKDPSWYRALSHASRYRPLDPLPPVKDTYVSDREIHKPSKRFGVRKVDSFTRDWLEYQFILRGTPHKTTEADQLLWDPWYGLRTTMTAYAEYWLPKDLLDSPEYYRFPLPDTFYPTRRIGEVQFIPKKGSYKWRPIAVPNRFLQMHMEPFGEWAYNLLRTFPRDCTFDQNRFDSEIKSRIDAGLYVGSVDLSKASDNLPFELVEIFIDSLTGRMSQMVLDSWIFTKKMFTDMHFESRSKSEQDSSLPYLTYQWKCGQPLGTLPSFALLGITNNLLCEVASQVADRYDHPYAVVGDDVIFFDPDAEFVYRLFLKDCEVPISEHKSYSGLLAEFAGKVFIKNQPVRYISDHSYLSWGSLFDYQRSAGVAIPFGNLPRRIRRKWGSFFSDISSAQRAYNIAQIAYAGVALDRVDKYSDELIAVFKEIELSTHEDTNMITSNFTKLNDQVIYHHGIAKNRNPQDWYKRKFRPFTTDRIVSTVALL
jgi:hypothetical protein